MQSFDQAADLEFEIGGERFLMRQVRPEVLAAWEDEQVPEKALDALAETDRRIKLFLDQTNGANDRWDTLRAREENPVTMGQLNALLIWMVEVQSGRPTVPPSPSAASPGRTVRSSRAG